MNVELFNFHTASLSVRSSSLAQYNKPLKLQDRRRPSLFASCGIGGVVWPRSLRPVMHISAMCVQALTVQLHVLSPSRTAVMTPNIAIVPPASLGHPCVLKFDVFDLRSGSALLAMYLMPCHVCLVSSDCVYKRFKIISIPFYFNFFPSIQVVTLRCPLLGTSVFSSIFLMYLLRFPLRRDFGFAFCSQAFLNVMLHSSRLPFVLSCSASRALNLV